MLNKPRILVGTANFGSAYGIKNNTHNIVDVSAVAQTFTELGISGLDTSSDYLDAEGIIGSAFENNLNLEIYTKYGHASYINRNTFRESVSNSLFRLKKTYINGVLLRDFDKLNKAGRSMVIQTLNEFKETGTVKKFGITVYSEDEMRNCYDSFPEFEIVQLPENLIDRRFLDSNFVKELKNKNVEIHIRSIFLQGLLLMQESEIPTKLQAKCTFFNELSSLSVAKQRSIFQLCIDYVAQIVWCDAIVVGINSADELREIVNALNNSKTLNFADFPRGDLDVIDPRKWSSL